jgi:uncharacterized protein (TIGR03382 family)
MRTGATLIIAIGLLVGCGSSADVAGPSEAQATPGGASESQVRAYADLQASSQRSWLWLQHDTLKTPMHLSADRVGEPMLKKGEDVGARTLSFLETNKQLFMMREPSLELSLKKSRVDAIGMTHARFQQVTHGVPVAGRELYAHYDSEGRLTSIDADYVPGLDDVSVEPALQASDALERAKAHILATSGGTPELRADAGRLVVYAPEGRPSAKLAYQYRIRALQAAEPAIWVTTVDASNGDIIHRYNDLQTMQGQGVGVLGGKETFQITSDGTEFVLTDNANSVEISTLTAETQQTTPGASITSSTQSSWDTGVTGAGAAVDAHVNAEKVFKYYKQHQARNAIDGAGGAMLSTVHFGVAYENAAWDGEGMLYGDGAQTFRPLSLALDVVGHEFTHGVTGSTSNLAYETQSGALNEAVSDIFGAMIEHVDVPDPKNNWLIAESIIKVGSPLRDMMDPNNVDDPQPAHMSQFVNTQQDNGGVHTNSGVINNAAFLMTVGGTNPVSNVEVKYGIGWDKAEKIWYRANTTYFKETTNFGQAAQGVLQAAKDLNLTDNEVNIIDCAFKATGVAQGTCATLTDPAAAKPASTTAGAGSDDGDTGSTAGSTSDDKDTSTPKKSTRKKAVTVQESGCNAAGAKADLSPFAAVLGVLLGLSARRRRRAESVSRTRP